jgi:hypothetical protein
MPAPTTNPGMWTQAQAEAYVDGLVTAPSGLENPGAYVDQSIAYATGLENPAVYPVIEGGPYTAPAKPHQLIEVNGKPCGQCR